MCVCLLSHEFCILFHKGRNIFFLTQILSCFLIAVSIYSSFLCLLLSSFTSSILASGPNLGLRRLIYGNCFQFLFGTSIKSCILHIVINFTFQLSILKSGSQPSEITRVAGWEFSEDSTVMPLWIDSAFQKGRGSDSLEPLHVLLNN